MFGYPAFVLNVYLQDNNKLPRWDEIMRVGVHLGRSKQHASNAALVLNLQTGNAIPQFHVACDDIFEAVDSLWKVIEPKRWRWLMEHDNECHVDEDRKIIDGTKIWTDKELESSVLFEVPKENQKDAKDSSATIVPSNTLKIIMK